MFREIRSLIMPKGVAVSISNISRSRHSQGLDFEVPVRFLPRYVHCLLYVQFVYIRFVQFQNWWNYDQINRMMKIRIEFVVNFDHYHLFSSSLLHYLLTLKSSCVYIIQKFCQGWCGVSSHTLGCTRSSTAGGGSYIEERGTVFSGKFIRFWIFFSLFFCFCFFLCDFYFIYTYFLSYFYYQFFFLLLLTFHCCFLLFFQLFFIHLLFIDLFVYLWIYSSMQLFFKM